MKKEYKESSTNKIVSAIIIAPLLGGLILWIWLGAIVVSVDFIHAKIMKYQFSAFLYKEIFNSVVFYTNTLNVDPKFISITLTLAVLIGLLGLALAAISFSIKTIYKLLSLLSKKQLLENKEEENK